MARWGVALVAAILMGYVQFRYAKANYPKSMQWRAVLFISGLVAGTFGVWALFPVPSVSELLLGFLCGGIPLGLISVYWLPQKSRTIIPESNTGDTDE
jgi:hypothetical protein